MWRTQGHQNQKLFLENVLKNKKFSHAYLFCGPSEIGKLTLAKEFAEKVLEPDPKLKFNPDLIVLDEGLIKIEQIRGLISELSLKPYQYQFKIAIINNFENVTEEAANSILKTLEEPNPSTILILVASNKKAILPTILSRVQVLYFNRLPDTAQQEMFDGKIGKSIRYNSKPEFKEAIEEQNKILKEIKKSGVAKRISNIKTFSEKESAELAQIFQNWLDTEHYQSTHGQPQLYKNLQLLSEALTGLKQNFNKKLILQKLFLNII